MHGQCVGTNKNAWLVGQKKDTSRKNSECERRAVDGAAKTKGVLRPGACSPLPSSIASTSCFMWVCVGLAGVAETAWRGKGEKCKKRASGDVGKKGGVLDAEC